MTQKNRYDVIIAGAGASGLSLLWYLIQSETLGHLKILLIDKDFSPKDDKTWSFWDSGNFPIDDIYHHTWNYLQVNANSQHFREELNLYKYHCIRSYDYARKILDMAKNSSRVELLETDILDFTHDQNSGVISTKSGEFVADTIFQSVLKPRDFLKSKVDTSMSQHFLGWEIETNTDLFDPETALLMDFDVDQQHGFTFMYELPFSKRKALLEYTLFSSEVLDDSVYEKGILSYIRNKYNLNREDFSIVRKEKGVIPMEDRAYSRWYCPHVMNMGTVGGLTKPTTGYTFRRIHEKCQIIVNALENETAIPDHPLSSFRFRVYDMMLLNILATDSDMSVQIFHDLFKKNNFDRILQFLEEKTSFHQELSIFWSVPSTPFLKSIYAMKHRILTGA
tara:strand:- start:8852 stop:10030 length:1179 start_codon:yes stop_codon:yes gene_type:complete